MQCHSLLEARQKSLNSPLPVGTLPTGACGAADRRVIRPELELAMAGETRR